MTTREAKKIIKVLEQQGVLLVVCEEPVMYDPKSGTYVLNEVGKEWLIDVLKEV